MKKILMTVIASVALAGMLHAAGADMPPKGGNIRLLYWNIQNGMWSGQPDNYDAFVEFVNGIDPDICVWCEGATIYEDNSTRGRKATECYLPANWGELAARYGHRYWFIGGYRDSYPQIVTSRHPLRGMSRITGNEADSIVSHGAGWSQVDTQAGKVNVVSLHTWPHRFSYALRDSAVAVRDDDMRRGGGDLYRKMEVNYVYDHTLGKATDESGGLWMMMGDFNSISPQDNFHYGLPADTTAFLVHRYMLDHTPYVDIVADKYPGEFKSSEFGGRRIDYVYCTPALAQRVKYVDILHTPYTEPVRDPGKLSNFCHPSDHCPIVVDFDLSDL